jgi:hypothetical protein
MQIITCSNCGIKLPDLKNNCTKCDSNLKTVNLSFTEKITIYEKIEGKAKDMSKRKKKKLVEHFIKGNEQSKNGEWIYKERIISPLKDYYLEKITDSKGEIIHFCEEKLSEHIGHGNAKFKAKS